MRGWGGRGKGLACPLLLTHTHLPACPPSPPSQARPCLLLQPFIGVVDQQLLEAVLGEALEAGNLCRWERAGRRAH